MAKWLVLGDIHGALEDVFALVPNLEACLGLKVTGILQAGDIAALGPESVLDKATRSHAEDDPTVLGFIPYLTGEKRATHRLAFVRGNHDDKGVLERAGRFVDPLRMLEWIPDGTCIELDDGFKVGSLGGIARPAGSKKPADAPRYFLDADAGRMRRNGAGIHLLLSHDGPRGACMDKPDAGSDLIRQLVMDLRPPLSVFGHYNRPCRPSVLGETLVVPMNQPDILRVPRRDGGVGILDTRSREFRFVYRDWKLVDPLGLPPFQWTGRARRED